MEFATRLRLPGFDAEAALVSHGRFAARPMAATARGRSPAAVVPELGIWKPGDCIPNCLCVQAEGCPCCGYQEMFPWVSHRRTWRG